MLRNIALLTSLFGLVLAGCSVSAEDAANTPTNDLKVLKTCLETQCAARMSRNASACSRCEDACLSASYDCDPSRACSASCEEPRECSDYERTTCDTEGFKAVLPNNPSTEIKAACEREAAFVRSCGYDVKAQCATYAAVEKPSVAAQYDCVAQLSCDDLKNDDALAACDLPPTTLGQELCDAIAACGRACTDKERDEIDREGAWLRDDAIKAGRGCLEQASCSDKHDCLTAWEIGVGMR